MLSGSIPWPLKPQGELSGGDGDGEDGSVRVAELACSSPVLQERGPAPWFLGCPQSLQRWEEYLSSWKRGGESGTSSKEQILVWIKERLAGCEKEQFSDQHRSGLKWTWSWNVHGHRAYVPCPSVSSHW